jgi:hypothetical protein
MLCTDFTYVVNLFSLSHNKVILSRIKVALPWTNVSLQNTPFFPKYKMFWVGLQELETR